MSRSLFSLIASALFLISLESSADTLRLGNPGYGGTGCPAGTASVTVSPDQKSLSLLFDNYVSEAGDATRKRMDRKSCNITVPVHVPQGFSVAVFQVDYRGFNSLPRGGQSRFNAEYFWAGSRGPLATKTVYGPVNADYTFTNGLEATALVWTPCGASVNLRVNTSLMVTTNSAMEQAMGTVDSADFTSGLIYHLQWRSCN